MTVLCPTCANVAYCNVEDVEGCAEYVPEEPECNDCEHDRLTCDATGRCPVEEGKEALG